jgi:hypothetical protein
MWDYVYLLHLAAHIRSHLYNRPLDKHLVAIGGVLPEQDDLSQRRAGVQTENQDAGSQVPGQPAIFKKDQSNQEDLGEGE